MNELLTIAKEAARESAAIIRDFYGNALVSEKEDKSPVTEADTAAHKLIRARLETTGLPILSEEDAERFPLPYPDRMWIVDPLDGTKGFIKKTDDFAVMIGLIENGRPVLGVVHCPIGDVVYSATFGGGSFIEKDGVAKQLRVSDRMVPTLRGLMSVNHAATYMTELGERLKVEEEIAVGSIGIKAGYIAHDRADFYVTRGALGEWDVCAPELILTEAGGTVTDTRGEPLCYGNENARIKYGIVFTNGVCHSDVVTVLGTID
jgi:3'(2'), 5'-bisphosphate nucleotidase